MKKVLGIIASAAMLMCSGCTGTYKSYVFTVDTGDKVEVKINTKDYGIRQENGEFFILDKDNEMTDIAEGFFLPAENYDYVADAAAEEPEGVTNYDGSIRCGEFEGFGYTYTADGEEKEEVRMFKISDKTAIEMFSLEPSERMDDIISNMSFGLED